MEGSLHRDEESFRRFFESGLVGMAVLTPEGTWIQANDRMCEILGYRLSELQQKHWTELTHPEDLLADLAQAQEFLSGRTDGYSMEKRFIHKDGRIVHALISLVCTRGPDGIPDKVLAQAVDITDRKRMEAALRESETRFREMAELLPQTIFELDSRGYFTFVNRASLEMFGYSRDQTDGLHVTEVFVPQECDRIRANIGKKLAGEPFDDHEYLAMRKDGSTFPVLIYSSLILRDGQVAGFRGILVDISIRHEWEQALRTSERRHRMLIETAMDGIWVIDRSGRLLEVNESYCKISGYSRDELLRMTVDDLDAVETPGQTQLRIRRICESGDSRFETKHRRKDGALIHVDLAVKMLDPAEGRLVVFVRDITEQRRIEDRTREREAMLIHAARLSTLGEMASGIAHELNQPLAAILSYGDACLHLAMSAPPDLSRIMRNLEEVVLQGERAGMIIRRMRALAKRQPPSFASISLNDVVRSAATLVRWELGQHQMKLSLELAESLPPVYADAIQIEQVLLNLMRNAMDAMRDGPDGARLLTLRTGTCGVECVCVEVRDTGVGLRPMEQDRIFEPFFTTKPDGLGIGLSISRKIIETHRGTLEARPNADRGATFFFTLPVHHPTGH